MEWLILPGLSLLGQLGAAIIWWKTTGIILQIVTLVGVFAVILGFLWCLIRVPIPTLLLFGILVLGLVYVDRRHPNLVVRESPQIGGEYEVSSRWLERGYGTYWTDRKLPKEWKPYEALIRIRIGREDMFIVLKEGRVYVLGINIHVKSVEPITGK